MQEGHILKVDDEVMACYYKDKQAPRGCSAWKGKHYPGKVLQLPEDYMSKGLTVMYMEEGNPIEQGVLTTSVKVAKITK